MKKLIFILVLGGLIITLSHCSGGKENGSKSLFTEVLKTSKGDIRGVVLNTTMDSVKQMEGKKPDSIADNYMEYRYELKSLNAKYSVAYAFDKSGLYSVEIDVKVFGNKDSSFAAIDTLEQKVIKLFTKKFGAPTKLSPEIEQWYFTSHSGQDASALLTDNSKIDGTGSLNIIVQTEVE